MIARAMEAVAQRERASRTMHGANTIYKREERKKYINKKFINRERRGRRIGSRIIICKFVFVFVFVHDTVYTKIQLRRHSFT